MEAVINRLRESYAQWVPVERAAQNGDLIGIDLRGTVEDRELAGMVSKEAQYVIDPERPQPVPGFAEQLVDLDGG